jgi:peptidoglycan/xylan/chitin deacetylase (PgdA/CDA1 family)
LGLFPAVRRTLPANLSVLAYHRIVDPYKSGFYGLKGNVSATPSAFEAQLEYMAGECNVISLDDLAALTTHGKPLPENAVLITFDDGYRDNYTTALPALAKRGLPAVLFAATGFVDGLICPFWDWVIQAFRITEKERAALPLLGFRAWKTADEREAVGAEWIKASLMCPHLEFRRALGALSKTIDLPLPAAPPPGLMMNWDELKAMMQGGFAIGAHSATHPVLLRTSPDRARREIEVSKAILEQRTNSRVTSFAFPNGLFSSDHEGMLASADYSFGFRVEGGLALSSEIKERPFAIRRTCIALKDDLPRFVAKVGGVARLVAW